MIMTKNLFWVLGCAAGTLILAGCNKAPATPSIQPIGTTPTGSSYGLDLASVKAHDTGASAVREGTIHHDSSAYANQPGASPDAQAKSTAQIHVECATNRYKLGAQTGWNKDGKIILSMPDGKDTDFNETRPDSMERKMIAAICAAPLSGTP